MSANVSNSTAQLNLIATWWPTVLEAHSDAGDAAVPARQNLLHRYCGAAHRYLLGAVRDPDVAGDLSQEFALRMLRGDFRRANPERGRFRDYIRSVLINLVRKHFRLQQRHPRALAEDTLSAAPAKAPAAGLSTFKKCLRDKVLEQAWEALEKVQPRYHAVLQLRAQAPELTSLQMADRLTATTGESWKADQVRKTLERARSSYVELLLEQVSSTLNCRGTEEVWEALAELELLTYCRAAVERRTLTK